MTLAHALIAANLLATCFMTGLIWFVQVVHYPLFAAVGRGEFAAYSRSHQSLTTLVVGPPMLLEAVSAALLLVVRPPSVPAWLAWTGLVLVAVIWLSTALLQVPAHGRLSAGFDAETGGFLVATNWIRTIAWSLRSAVVVWMLAYALRPANG